MGAGRRRPLACCLLGCSRCRAGGGCRLLQQWESVEGQGTESGPLSVHASVLSNKSEKYGCDSKRVAMDLQQHAAHCGSCLAAALDGSIAAAAGGLESATQRHAKLPCSGMPSCSTTLVR